MARQVLGLVGPGKGPRVFVGQMRALRARVTGMNDGVVTVKNEHGEWNLLENGSHPVGTDKCEFLEVCYVGESKAMICVFLGESA